LYVIDAGTAIGPGICYQDESTGQWNCYRSNGWTGELELVGQYPYCQCSGGDGCTWYCNSDGPPGYVKYGPSQYQYDSPELSTSWNFSLNIDLKPYVTNGPNTIFMRTIVAGAGEGAIQLTTRQKCPLNCSVSTNNQCATLEAMAQ
jgi:hypothetical protein